MDSSGFVNDDNGTEFQSGISLPQRIPEKSLPN